MKIAIEGCCHDELEVIYNTIEHIQHVHQERIDLLLVCGDFEAVRNPADLQTMACPKKYRDMKYFYKYYKGEKVAPVLTIVIGGNHEASNHMQELPYGGWLAPKIYFLGYAGIVNVGGVRIGGLSGLYKTQDYHKGHFERPPYNDSSMRTAYHIRSIEIFRLKQVKEHIDIFLSHEWPVHAVYGGNYQQLMRYKEHFKDDIENGQLGSTPHQEVLNYLQPDYWFAAHLHCKFAAVIQHKSSEGQPNGKITKFLALDKVLPRREFLQVIEVPHTETNTPLNIKLDAEWLCILKLTNHLMNISETRQYMPGIGANERYDFSVTDEEKRSLVEDFGGDLSLPDNFTRTVAAYDGWSNVHDARQPACKVNPQTTLLSQMLGITDPFAIFTKQDVVQNPDEISLGDESSSSDSNTQDDQTDATEDERTSAVSLNQSATSVYNQISAVSSDHQLTTVSSNSQLSTVPSDNQLSAVSSDNQLSAVSCDNLTTTVSSDTQISTVSTEAQLSTIAEESQCSTLAPKRTSQEIEDGKSAPPTSEPVKSGPPKFKRRNQTIYSNDT